MRYFFLVIISILFVSVNCGYQRQFQFQRRASDFSADFSHSKPCTEAEKQKLKKESEIKINADNADEDNAYEDDFEIFMPVVEIPKVKLGKVLSCSKTNFKDGGYSFQMRVKGLEGGDPVICSIQGVHDKNRGSEISASECQG